MAWRTRAIFAAALSPANRSLCGVIAPSGAGGRSGQIASIGFDVDRDQLGAGFLASGRDSRATASGV